jgi:hypothetical protein
MADEAVRGGSRNYVLKGRCGLVDVRYIIALVW